MQIRPDIDSSLYCRHRGLQPDEALVKVYLEKIDKTLNVYEQILSKQNYIAGNVSILALGLGAALPAD